MNIWLLDEKRKNMLNNKNYIQHLQDIVSICKELSALENKTLLITGSSGLIGSFFVDLIITSQISCNLILLSQNHQSISKRFFSKTSRQKIIFDSLDFLDMPKTKTQKIDYIIHLASPSDPLSFQKSPISTINANTLLTQKLLDFASFFDSKMIFLSTGEIYGELQTKTPIQENNFAGLDPMDVRNCYNISKKMAENLCASYQKEKNIKFVILRACRCFGPTMKTTDSRAISVFLRSASKGEDIVLKSSGLQIYSYIYVADMIRAILYALELLPSNEVYNVASDETMILKDMAEIISSFNNHCSIIYDLKHNDGANAYSRINQSVLNTEKIKKAGFQCRFSLYNALRLTYDIIKGF